MSKNTIKKADRIEADALAFNAAQDAGTVDADAAVISMATVLMDLCETAGKADKRAKGATKSFILECALVGMALADVKAIFTSDVTWPKDGQEPQGEKKARGTRAGDAYRACVTYFSRLRLDENGVPVVQETEEGFKALVALGKDSKQAVARFAELDTPPEAAVVAHWQAILDSMSPENFDRLRPDLGALGCPMDLLQKPGYQAAA